MGYCHRYDAIVSLSHASRHACRRARRRGLSVVGAGAACVTIGYVLPALPTGGAQMTSPLGARRAVLRCPDRSDTSLSAYDDIAPLLQQLAAHLGKQAAELAIYDPYYSAGGAPDHRRTNGFAGVHNQDEDFYAKIVTGTTPAYDVLLACPSIGGDHLERLLRFAVAARRSQAAPSDCRDRVSVYTRVQRGAERHPGAALPAGRG